MADDMSIASKAEAIQNLYRAGVISLQDAGLRYMQLLTSVLADYEAEKAKVADLERRMAITFAESEDQ